MKTGYLTKKIEKIKYPDDALRNYIGASSIGGDCLRKIWYEFNGYKGQPIPARIKRIFETGHILEKFVIDLLKRSGVIFESYQDELFDCDLPYFRGHFDGFMKKPSGLLEVKTTKDSEFKVFVKHGLKQWNAGYYAQMQAYMGMSGVHTAYLIALNKDTSELHDERVLFDEDYYFGLRRKARMIHESEDPPAKVSSSPLWWQCKMCKFNKECHK